MYLQIVSDTKYHSLRAGHYRTLRAASAKNNSKNRCRKFWNIIGIFAEYNINYFSKLPKSKIFLLLTRILLTT